MPRYAIGIPKRQKKHTKNRKSKRGQPPSILHVHTPPIENNKASKASRHGVRHWPARSQPNRAAESTRGAVSLCPRSAQREPPSLPAGRQVGKRLLTGVATCRQHGSPCGDAHTHAMQARRCSRLPFSFRAPLMTIFSEWAPSSCRDVLCAIAIYPIGSVKLLQIRSVAIRFLRPSDVGRWEWEQKEITVASWSNEDGEWLVSLIWSKGE